MRTQNHKLIHKQLKEFKKIKEERLAKLVGVSVQTIRKYGKFIAEEVKND